MKKCSSQTQFKHLRLSPYITVTIISSFNITRALIDCAAVLDQLMETRYYTRADWLKGIYYNSMET